MSRARGWVFTHNNYSDTASEDAVECQYMVYGKEVGAQGTPHLQGYVYFETLKSLKQVTAVLPGCHVEPAITVHAAQEYCKKEGEWKERGVPPVSNKEKGKKGGEKEKRRWDEIRVACEEGRFEDLPDDIRYKNLRLNKQHRCEALRSRTLEDTEEEHLWYWGEAGTGKSRKAREENPNAYLKMCNKWWCGYTDEDTVLIEDFDKKHDVLGHHLKIWADRYPFLGELKGDTMKIRPKKIIVTSNYHPDSIWTDEETLGPIKRRFKIVQFKKLAY